MTKTLYVSYIYRNRKMDKKHADAVDRYKTIFAVTSVGIGITDEQGKIVECNKALTSMLGYTEDELYGRRIQEFNHPDDVLREEQTVLGLTEQDPRTPGT